MAGRELFTIIAGIVLVVASLVAAWYALKPSVTDPPLSGTEDAVPDGKDKPVSYRDLIVVDAPLPGATIANPLLISGKARGNWYFEASFPVSIYDSSGKRLAQAPAQALGEWMTTEYVPFSLSLPYEAPTTATGTLVLEKDNPSGLPQFDDRLTIPLRFPAANPAAATTSVRNVKLYAYDAAKDQGNGGARCSEAGIVAIERTVPRTETPIKEAVTLLLRGELTNAERAQGLTSQFPLSGVTLKSATLSRGVVTLTFEDPQHQTTGGACRTSILRNQLEATAKQFAGVSSVRLLPEDLFQP